MSKQTAFYMTLEEELIFWNFIRQERNVKIVSYYSATEKLELYDSFPVEIKWAEQCYLWDTDHSPEPFTKFIKAQNYFLTDEDHCELILFERTQFYDKRQRICHGRIFIDNKIWQGDILVERPKVFLEWYEKLAKWVRKNGLYRSKLGYVYPGVENFLEEHPEYSLE